MGMITTEFFKTEIQRRDKANSKRAELLHIVTAYRDALTDIVWPYYVDAATKTMGDWKTLETEIRALVDYIDECLRNLATVYGSKATKERNILLMY
jgi:hypothetical protein